MMQSLYKVWIDPRGVMRSALEKESARDQTGIFLFIAYISSVLTVFTSFTWQEPISFLVVAIIAVIAGLVVAPLSLYLYPILLKWIGGWLEGKATAFELRVAVLYSSLKPQILISLISLPFIFIIGETFFYEDFGMYSFDQPAMVAWSTSVLLFLNFVLGIWIFVVHLHAVAEVHQFSAWKALLVEVILGLILFFVLVVVFLFTIIIV